MLQKAKSDTTSSKSATSKPDRPADEADTDVQFVKGVGPRLGSIFKSRDIATVRDLLQFFPRAYEDRTKMSSVSELEDGKLASLALEVTSSRQIPIRGRTMLEVKCKDASGPITLKWFHAPKGMSQRFAAGTQFIATGEIKTFMGKPQLIHPEITWNLGADTGGAPSTDGMPDVGRVVPIYVEIEGVSSRVLRKVLWEGLKRYGHTLGEDLPEEALRRHGLPPLKEAVRSIHFPEESDGISIPDLVAFNTPAHARLIYEEFFKFEYLILKQRLRMEKLQAPAFGKGGGPEGLASLEKLLPFALTGDQKKAVAAITADLSQPHPMNRLIQGDVGSGKTAVALLTAGFVLAEGGQAALMAPTEILAEQHYKNAIKLFGGKLNVALLMGKTPQSERTQLFARLSSGEPLLLIGTHALIEDPVRFKNLVYVMIDEQHRFGVEQRRTLRNKGTRDKVLPHSLVLTATPIPRTLALTAYGDLTVTAIQEMPPGRTPIVTKVVRDKTQRGRAYELIRNELRQGHQAYFIYPLVNDSEAEGFTELKSAVAEAERLQREVFPDFKVGLLHGQLKPEEKAQVMDAYKRNELQILVSTTVVEVGVDVPNATIMAIAHSERFGLSQLHQLRGRVGRGAKQSFCFLFANQRSGEATTQRLEVLEETTDGFKIAEADLEIRGPGEFLGTRQAGGLPFKLANLVRDQKWLILARDDASALLKKDPELSLPENSRLRRYYEREGKLQSDRLGTS